MSVLVFRPFAFIALFGVMGFLYGAVLGVSGAGQVEAPRDEQVALYQHHDALGWVPRAAPGTLDGPDGPIAVRPNTLGLRDAELDSARSYRLLVMGGASVWGAGVEAADRFTDRLEARRPRWDVVNAGMSGFGTDQSLLLARRLAASFRPTAVVLVFDPATDRRANQTNVSPDGHYKPYFVLDDTTLVLRGQPVPQDVAFRDSDYLRVDFARLLADAAIRIRHPAYVGPDPSEALLVRFREEVGRVGVSFYVAFTRPDARAAAALDAAGIPWISLDAYAGPDFSGWHWTPDGHAAVAKRLDGFLSERLAGWDG